MVRKIDIYRQDKDDINWVRLGVNWDILIGWMTNDNLQSEDSSRSSFRENRPQNKTSL